jgi:hypothetical protein
MTGKKAAKLFFLVLFLLGLGETGRGSGENDGKFIHINQRNPGYLEQSDGKTYIPIGLNLIHPDQAAGRDEKDGLNQMKRWMEQLSHFGGNYIRLWLSAPFWDVERQRSGQYEEQQLLRIQQVLEIARQQGIHVKLTLEHFRTVDGPGPQPWAHKPLYLVSNGGPASNTADFFDGTPARDQFKRKLQWYAEKIGEDPAVYGWELWNEINAVAAGDHLGWTEVMLAELHRLFPRQLAMQSLGSFDSDAVRGLYHRMMLLPGNDVAQVHRYLDLGATLEVCHGPVDLLAADAVRELRTFHPGKPVLLAESGAVEAGHAGPFKLYQKDRSGIILHDILFAPFFAGAAGPGQCWHWDSYVDRNNLWFQFGRFAEAIKDVDPAAESFHPGMLPHARLRVYALEGNSVCLLWCRDSRNDWRSELLQDIAPETLSQTVLSLKGLRLPQGKMRVQFYDPWKNSWSEGALKKGSLQLPAFSRSLVVRIRGE